MPSPPKGHVRLFILTRMQERPILTREVADFYAVASLRGPIRRRPMTPEQRASWARVHLHLLLVKGFVTSTRVEDDQGHRGFGIRWTITPEGEAYLRQGAAA